MTAYDPGSDPTYRLTRRQREILEMLGCGLANKQIALQLGIHSQTVKNHMARVRRNLGAQTSMQALRIAIERKLIEIC
jgi:DNA-binding NarL/FixJ family response regulator